MQKTNSKMVELNPTILVIKCIGYTLHLKREQWLSDWVKSQDRLVCYMQERDFKYNWLVKSKRIDKDNTMQNTKHNKTVLVSKKDF